MLGTRLKWLGAGALLAAGTLLWWRRAGTPQLELPAVVTEIQRLNELASVKYMVQRVVGMEEKKSPFGAERILLIVQAEVVAGIELDKLAAHQLTAKGAGQFAIALPPPKILHIVIDEKQTRVWDRAVTWWTPWVPANPDLERQARLAAREDIEKAAIEMGILTRAKENAQMSIRALLMAFGARSVVFVPGS